MSERLFWWHHSKDHLRWWFHFGRNCFHIQLAKPQFHMTFGIRNDGEETLNGDFFGFYWHLDSWEIGRRLPTCSNSFRFYWHDAALWFSLWGNDWEGSRHDPWWRRMFVLHFDDLLLGKSKYSKTEGERFENVVIPMPEGQFLATLTFETHTWKRPRWFADVRKYTHVSLEKPPTFPGKGENSWDCGDDAIYGSSYEGHSIANAIGGYVTDVLKYRERYGGRRHILADKA